MVTGENILKDVAVIIRNPKQSIEETNNNFDNF
jgi:hypothetical protein